MSCDRPTPRRSAPRSAPPAHCTASSTCSVAGWTPRCGWARTRSWPTGWPSGARCSSRCPERAAGTSASPPRPATRTWSAATTGHILPTGCRCRGFADGRPGGPGRCPTSRYWSTPPPRGTSPWPPVSTRCWPVPSPTARCWRSAPGRRWTRPGPSPWTAARVATCAWCASTSGAIPGSGSSSMSRRRRSRRRSGWSWLRLWCSAPTRWSDWWPRRIDSGPGWWNCPRTPGSGARQRWSGPAARSPASIRPRAWRRSGAWLESRRGTARLRDAAALDARKRRHLLGRVPVTGWGRVIRATRRALPPGLRRQAARVRSSMTSR